MYSSLEYIGNFLRVSPPRSIWPLNHKDRIDIMTGSLVVISVIDWKRLALKLEEAGWEVELCLPQEIKQSGVVMRVTKAHLANKLNVDVTLLFRLVWEFLSFEGLNEVLVKLGEISRFSIGEPAVFFSPCGDTGVWQ